MRSLRPFALFFLLITGTLGFAQSAHAWWNDQWAFRKEITFDLTPAGADIGGSPTDVPVLIRLSLANFGYFNDAQASGADLRFVASDDKTPLESHIERFDPQAQIAFVWVRVPRLTGGAATDKIYLYYGNGAAQAGASTGTYDKNQTLVYHFGAPAGAAQDATAYQIEPIEFTAEVSPASLIGAGVRFSGGQHISIPAEGALGLEPARGLTLSAWVRIDAAQQNAYVASLQDGDRMLVLGIDQATPYIRWASSSGDPVVVQSSTPVGLSQWRHLAVRAGNGQVALMLDGVETASAAASLASVGGTLTVGASAQGTNPFIGELDELQVSNVARSTEWIEAQARSQGMVAPLVVYGGDAQKDSGGSESYFATTLRNVTVDGWVVIGILMVMFVAAIAVMAGKALYLNRVARGNAKFLAEFHRLRDDPAALERREGGEESEDEGSAFEGGGGSQIISALTASSSTYGVSTLWTLYHHGMRAAMKRLEGQAAGADRVRTLSPQSIEAIRATMAASLTRMSQRLSSQMVLLTIAISGGPFLGLLGTVVGVMITFAAIAATGDVNINAIAPGTAAALVATVAGLGVAIPCLFGYNYLNTRVKEITADMHVFVDEFVTRIAETYS